MGWVGQGAMDGVSWNGWGGVKWLAGVAMDGVWLGEVGSGVVGGVGWQVYGSMWMISHASESQWGPSLETVQQ